MIGRFKKIIATPLFLYTVAAAIILALFIIYIVPAPAGLSPAEQTAKVSSQSVSVILKSPVNAPHHLLDYGLHAAGLGWKTALRSSSAIFTAIFILCFYSVLKAWFGRFIGMLGSLFFAATPLVIVLARQGSSEVMYLSITAVMAAYMRLVRAPRKDLNLILLLIIGALSIYIPGLIWWLAGGIIVSRRKLSASIADASPAAVAASFLIAALIVVPLVLSLIKDWTVIQTLVLVPTSFEPGLRIAKNIAWMILALFIKSPYHSNFILGRLAVLNVIQIALLAFGAFALWQAARSKLWLMIAGAVFAVIAAGLNNRLSLLALGLPALGVIVCAGLRYLYIEWRSVFPRNPVAHTLAYSLMAVLVIIQLIFGIRYGVAAWPHTLDTRHTYMLK